MNKDHPCYDCGKCCEKVTIDYHSTIDTLKFYLFALKNKDFKITKNRRIHIAYNKKPCASIGCDPNTGGLKGELANPCPFLNKEKTCDIYYSKIKNEKAVNLLNKMHILEDARSLVCKTYSKFTRRISDELIEPINNWLRKRYSKDKGFCKMFSEPFYKNLDTKLIFEVNLSNNLNLMFKKEDKKHFFQIYNQEVIKFFKEPCESKAINLLELIKEYNSLIYTESIKIIK